MTKRVQAVREFVPLFSRSLRIFDVVGTRFEAPLQFHPELELTWIRHGSGQRLVLCTSDGPSEIWMDADGVAHDRELHIRWP